MTLADKTCIPCRGGVPPLTANEAAVFGREVPAWACTHGATLIERRFRFADFAAALAFVNEVGALAEEEGHHPDIAVGWGYANIAMQTHKIKGLHENDFIMAAKIDAIAAATG
ncbi:MAG: 4a-hydroxytetrahydrobiopterin dehydratase [Proteobacteria bacterium]|nr:4a-hydroxytetrahydrobiopterin dehydratase [Pseudomonadota bacterium]MDA1057608.1 4a-hydroxytetrahydrobiopterin dehydratase [Pseudomonadota bacterium]